MDRRSFLTDLPAWVAIAEILSQAEAQQTAGGALSTPASPEVIDFWVNQMGVPPDKVLGGHTVAGGITRGAGAADAYGREPQLFYVDEATNKLIAAEELPKEQLEGKGDMQVDFELMRLRLNEPDAREFDRYSSGAVYLDFQQNSQTATPEKESLGSAIFSAIFPANPMSGPAAGSSKSGGVSKPSKSTASASTKTPKKTKASSTDAAPVAEPAPAPAASGPAGAGLPPVSKTGAVNLTSAGQKQTIALPSGIGKTAFSAFAKDPKKSAFGMVMSAMLNFSNSPILSAIPFLSASHMATSALTNIRSIVGNMQIEGGSQVWILQSPPVDVAATVEALSKRPDALRLRTGTYIAVPKAHLSALTGKLTDMRVMDGFLVPAKTDVTQKYNAAFDTLKDVSYLSLRSTTRTAKVNGCGAPQG